MNKSILCLPDEILCKIFFWFPLSFCLKTVSKVCKNWHCICSALLPWKCVQIGEGNFLRNEKTLLKIVKHSSQFNLFDLSNTLEMYMPINGFTFIVEKYFNAPKLQELNLSYTNISTLHFLKFSPFLNTLILRKCFALPSFSLLSINQCVTENLMVFDISYCILKEGTALEQIVWKLPQFLEFYAYGIPISQASLMRILEARAFNKLQVFGAHCEPGHRKWEYVVLIVSRYPDFVLKLNEFEDDTSSIVSYPSGSN